jgi:hypothetical protein
MRPSGQESAPDRCPARPSCPNIAPNAPHPAPSSFGT